MGFQCYEIVQTVALSVALVFSIVAIATESWSQVKFDVNEPSSSSMDSFTCSSSQVCFVVSASYMDLTSQSVQADLQTNQKMNINASYIQIEYVSHNVTGVIVSLPSNQIQQLQSQLTTAVASGKVVLTCTPWDSSPFKKVAKPYVAPADDVLHFVVDFGLFRECFAYTFPLPEFQSPLSTSVCFSKADICHLVDSQNLVNEAASLNAGDVQKDISTICRKMSATAALSGITSSIIAVVCLLTIFPTARRLAGRFAGIYAQIVYISAAACCSLCAIIVWATADIDGKSLETHFKEQLMSTEPMVQLFDELMPYNFSFEMGYSHGLEITTLALLVAALAITIMGLKKVWIATHQCFAKKQLTLASLSGNNDDDCGEDELLAGAL